MISIINKFRRREETLKYSLTTLLATSLFLLSGCDGGGGSSDATTPVVSETLNIASAVYDNNATATVLDDKLYIYFTESINPSSIAVDTSANYALEGTGAIGTASGSDYNDTIFHRHLITLNNDGSASTALVANDTNITMAQNTITDASGEYPSNYNKVTLEKFRVMLKTGQTISYVANDDGNLSRGVARSYTDNGQTVTDNVTGLIWQKEDDNTMRNWADAGTYCAGITLDGNPDFRLPTIEELVSITDKGRSNPTINPVFTNTNSSGYWSSTTDAAVTTYAWLVYFGNGLGGAYTKTNNYWVRCVR